MSPALFRLGETFGPSVVVRDDYTVLQDGRTIEIMEDALGNGRIVHGREDDRTYHPVSQRSGSVLVPFTRRHPETEAGLPSHAVWVDVSATPYDYWRVLCDWWVLEDLTIIEHDVKARPEIFAEFALCPEPWCYNRYGNHTPENANAWHYGILGCTRFRKELIAAVPKAVTDTEERHRDWHYLSTSLGAALRSAGYEPHVHEPPVEHHRFVDLRAQGIVI